MRANEAYENREELAESSKSILGRANKAFEAIQRDKGDHAIAFGRGYAAQTVIQSLEEGDWDRFRKQSGMSDDDWAAYRSQLENATAEELDAALRPQGDNATGPSE